MGISEGILEGIGMGTIALVVLVLGLLCADDAVKSSTRGWGYAIGILIAAGVGWGLCAEFNTTEPDPAPSEAIAADVPVERAGDATAPFVSDGFEGDMITSEQLVYTPKYSLRDATAPPDENAQGVEGYDYARLIEPNCETVGCISEHPDGSDICLVVDVPPEPYAIIDDGDPDIITFRDHGRYKLHFGDTITATKLEDIEPVKDEITEEEKEMSGVTWPKVFVSPESVRYDSTLRAEADLFCAKGLLLAGHKPPEKYGEGCVAITETIGKDRYLEIMRSPRSK